MPANFSKPAPAVETRRKPVPTHSVQRSSSIGSVRDGVGNLNRWSQSTVSSRGSPAHTRSGSFSRRLSLGSVTNFDFGGKLSKASNQHTTKGSVSSIDASPRTGSRQANRPPNSTAPLPLLNTLPLHDPSRLATNSASPSTADILSAAVRTTVPDYFGNNWEESTPISSTRSPSRARSPLPASSVFNPSNPSRNGHRHGRERSNSRGHSRNRSRTNGSSSATGERSTQRHQRGPSQKAMLSKALQKAHQAVVLDNERNVEGAKESYKEACALLLQVMSRSSGESDRLKLEAIRDTYTSRIAELEQINLDNENDKALPARPESTEYRDEPSPLEDEDDTAVIGMAVVTRIVTDDSYEAENEPEWQPNHIAPSQVPRRRESLMPSAFNTQNESIGFHTEQPRSMSRQNNPIHLTVMDRLSPPMDRQSMMVQPLSPRRAPSPNMAAISPAEEVRVEMEHLKVEAPSSTAGGHRRAISTESVSWLDTIDESGGSETSSVHSRTSSLNVRRKHIRAASGATEAEFDAALDAAVEAAYDDGFEPVMEPIETAQAYEPSQQQRSATALDDYDDRQLSIQAKLEKARERIREAERETAIMAARDRERERRMMNQQQSDTDGYDNESDEEERMLDEMTRGYVMDDFDFGVQSKSALPRESGSSGFSGSNWHNSLASTAAGSSMSTITEQSPTSKKDHGVFRSPSMMHPPPGQPLPAPPSSGTRTPQFSRPLNSLSETSPAQDTVRNRRLSGQNPKQLVIETNPAATPIAEAANTQSPAGSRPATSSGPTPVNETAPEVVIPPIPKSEGTAMTRTRTGSESVAAVELSSPPTPSRSHNPFSLHDAGDNSSRSGSPGRAQSRAGLRKNLSSSSLKNLKSRNLSVTKIDENSDVVSDAPMAQFATANASKLPAMPSLPTPIATAFSSKMNMPSGGLYLFENEIHYPPSPTSSSGKRPDAPVPLEPCPTEHMLRPFWFMRALYQTLVHKKGGYISNKLFIPQDVWKVKNVKIKGLEEKISSCDFLTAALQKLGQVDTCDADAVLEEMQSLEDVLEQIKVTLVKKLGSEVGIQHSGSGLFRDAPPSTDAETSNVGGSKTSSLPGKTSSFSWRRLRSKSSGLALNNYHTKTAVSAPDSVKETLTMSTLPMTTLTSVRFTKRHVAQAQFTGPNAAYMSSLAKLFDAAQVIDQIARQVEDPGLKHADKTQVGLELSTRHAAEFFGFYICRFVLTDVTLLLDKYVKRGSEWVMI